MIRKSRVSLGLIGVGGQGEKIVEAVLKTANLKLAACYHYKQEIAEKYAKRYQCQPFYHLDTMLKRGEIEGVIIATPNYLHYEQMKECIKYNKHIFVEKPITNKLSEAMNIIKGAQMREIVLMVGHNLRRHAAVRKIKKIVDGGVIGDLVSAEINLSHAGAMKFTKDKWRFHKNKCPGGSLIMLGIHLADISNYLFGPALRVAARVKKLYAPTEAEDTGLLLIELKSGSTVYLSSNYNTPSTYFIRVYGTKGILEFNRNQGQLTFQGLDIERRPRPLRYVAYDKENDTFLEEMEEFGNCILYNKKPETGGLEAFDALAIVKAALDSQRKNKFVKIENYA